MSNERTAIAWPSRLACASSTDARSSKPRRFSRPVSVSVRASPASRTSSSSLRRVSMRTTAATTETETMTSTQRATHEAVGDADTGDNRDRAGQSEEEHRPQHGPHVENGTIAGGGNARQCGGDQPDPDRSERGQRPAWQPRTDCQQNRDDRESDEPRSHGEAGATAKEALDQVDEDRGAVHGGRG